MNPENSAEYHLDQALRHQKAKDFDQALEECGLAIECDPDLADAYNLQGCILEDIDQPLRALGAYKEALKIDPDFAEAQENLDALRAELAVQRELVTIAAFSHPIQAHISKSRLEAEGIWAFVADEYTVTANWLFSNALGGVRLQVRGEDVEKATEILDREPEPIDWEEENEGDELEGMEDDEDPQECPHCGSDNIRYEKYATRPFFLSWLLLGFPIPFLKRTWVCHECNHSWKV